MEAVMKKFNNTLEGTDCGDAGMPARGRDVTKATSVLRVVPNTPEIESIAPRRYLAKRMRLGGICSSSCCTHAATPRRRGSGSISDKIALLLAATSVTRDDAKIDYRRYARA